MVFHCIFLKKKAIIITFKHSTRIFSFPLNIGLEVEQFHQKIISKQHWKREGRVSEQCDTSWVSEIVVEKHITTTRNDRWISHFAYTTQRDTHTRINTEAGRSAKDLKHSLFPLDYMTILHYKTPYEKHKPRKKPSTTPPRIRKPTL